MSGAFRERERDNSMSKQIKMCSKFITIFPLIYGRAISRFVLFFSSSKWSVGLFIQSEIFLANITERKTLKTYIIPLEGDVGRWPRRILWDTHFEISFQFQNKHSIRGEPTYLSPLERGCRSVPENASRFGYVFFCCCPFFCRAS